MSDGVTTYRVSVTDEIEASSPQAAVRVFLHRLQNEETAAKVVKLDTGKIQAVECQTGEFLHGWEAGTASCKCAKCESLRRRHDPIRDGI